MTVSFPSADPIQSDSPVSRLFAIFFDLVALYRSRTVYHRFTLTFVMIPCSLICPRYRQLAGLTPPVPTLDKSGKGSRSVLREKQQLWSLPST